MVQTKRSNSESDSRLQCPECRSADIRPSRHHAGERLLLRLVHKRPYRCWVCGCRFYASTRYFRFVAKQIRRDIQESTMAISGDPDSLPKNRRQGPVRSAEDRRKIIIPPPPGSPVRSGQDRRKADRRSTPINSGSPPRSVQKTGNAGRS